MLKRLWLALLYLTLAGCSVPRPGDDVITLKAVALPDLGAAPELTNSIWLNTDAPAATCRPARQGGRPGNVDLRLHQLPARHSILEEWYAVYKDQGFVLIGNHFPEFGVERDLDNLKQAVAQAGIEYPVAQDNDGATWNAYHNQYWPALYLIDKRGHIRYVHIGEGAYAETEANIQGLLAEAYP